jgi:predicted MFS family arabinose efflux permease
MRGTNRYYMGVNSGLKKLLTSRDYRLLWAGQGISEVGSSVTNVALPLLAVATLGASAAQVGLVTAAGMAAWLVFALPFGAWADRRRRRPLLIGADLGRAALLATLPLAALAGRLTIVQVGLVAFVVGVLNVVFDVAYPAYLPTVLPPDRLVDGNGLLTATDSAAGIGGPALGGLLIQAVGAAAAVLVDSVSFVGSALTLGLIGVREPEPVSRPGRRLRADLAEGLRFVFGWSFTRALVFTGALGNFALGGYTALTVVFLYRTVGLRGAAIGVLLAVGGVGAVLGSLAAGPMVRWLGDARVVWLAPVLAAAGGQLVPWTRRGAGVALFVVGAFALSVGLAMFNVCVRAAIQATVPARLLARAGASIRMFSRGAWPVGAVTAGALAGATGPRLALGLVISVFAVSPVVLLLSPVRRVRTIRELSPGPDTVPV